MDRGAARLLGCFALWSAGVVAACNSIAGLDADYELAEGASTADSGDGTSSGATSGGTSGTSGTSGGSSGTSGSIDAEPDAPGDGGTSETGPPEGGPDADPADAGADTSAPDAGRFCSGITADFCDDFDSEPWQPWSRNEEEHGTWSVVSVGGADKELRAVADEANRSRKLVIWQRVSTNFAPGTGITLTFSFRIASNSLAYAVIGGIQINQVEYDGGRVDMEFGLAAYGDCGSGRSPCFDRNNPPPEGNHQFSPSRVRYDLDKTYAAEITVRRLPGGTYRGTLKVDGVTIVDDTDQTFFGNASPNEVEVGVGMFFTDEGPGTGDVFVDDVVVRRL